MVDILTVVMSDPLDTEAIEEVEKVSGCKVQPFVGILSDIVKAIEDYYNVIIEDESLKSKKFTPLFIHTRAYKGMERRRSVRINVELDIHFAVQDTYKKSVTKNLSLNGFLFESDSILPIGSYVILQINLSKKYHPYPIGAVVQVIRVTPLVNNKFDIGVKLIKIPKDDAKAIIAYARAHQE